MSKPYFGWQDRDTAARDMLQLVYHGTERIRNGALTALSAIRSPLLIPELKAIALDETWPYTARRYALSALAALPKTVDLPELAPMIASYLEHVQQGTQPTEDEDETERQNVEFIISHANFELIGKQSSNWDWFFNLLNNIDVDKRGALLCEAIGATCQTPLEPVLIEQLKGLINHRPDLLTLKIAETIGNHGDSESSEKFLLEYADRLLELSLTADPDAVSSMLGYSPALTEKFAETHLELAKLSSLYQFLEKSPSSEPNTG